MKHPLPYRPFRAPRIAFQGTVSVLLQMENLRRLPAKLQTLSTTGGLLEIAKYLDERAKVSMTFEIGSNVLRPKAQMLFPMRDAKGYLQPFRFTSMSAEELQILDKEITLLLKKNVLQTPASHGLGFRPPRFYLE